MLGPMATLLRLETSPAPPPESRPLGMGVRWESPLQAFGSSLRAFFTSLPVPKDSDAPYQRVLRIDWVQGRFPGSAFVASSLWHVAAVLILLLPIWKWLPKTQPALAPVRIELTWYAPSQDLPTLTLPGPAKKPSPPGDHAKPLPRRGADAYHPRQTILSTPVRVTHPRQTLIQPAAPPEPPKIVPQMPNIVEWAASSPRPQPKLQITPTAASPRLKQRAVADVAVPELVNHEKTPGPLNVALSPAVNPMPRMPVNPMSTPVAERRRTQQDPGAAPELGSVDSSGDASMHRLIALSATPGPPAPEVAVPQGNLAARIAISPDGKQPGVPGGAENGSGGNGGAGGDPGAMGGMNGANGTATGSGGGGAGSLPAAVSISGGSNQRSGIAGTGGGHTPGKLILRPPKILPSAPDPEVALHRGPAVVGNFDPSLPPEKLLSGKEIYTMHVNMPNLTSSTGSWVLHCAQLDEEMLPAYKRHGALSGPVPMEKADPKYPPGLIKEHVQGDVVLYAIIRKNGSVDSIQLVRGLDPELDHNAMEALSRWKFRPGTREGEPIDIEAVVHIPFKYRAAD